MTTNDNSAETGPIKRLDALADGNKNGQMLVIYLPEGSVIVDRTDINLSAAPQQIVEKTVTTPITERKPYEDSSTQPSQTTLQEIVQIAIQEVLQNSLKTSEKSEIPTRPEIPTKSDSHPHVPRLTHGVHFPRRRISWIHGINTLLVTYIILVSVLPAMLSSFFGIGVYASKVSHPYASISAGDLMITRQLLARDLRVNDVLLVRNADTWRLDARQVTARTKDATGTILTTVSTRGQSSTRQFSMSDTSKVFKVSTIVPKLGYVPMILSSTLTKVLGGLFVLFLNVRVHFQRSRRRRLGIPVQPI